MKAQAAVLWLAALAVFVLLNPIEGIEPRDWQEVVLIYGGLLAAVVVMAGALPPALLFGWCIALAAIHRTPASLGTVLMILAALGLFAAARRGPAAQIVRVIVALNVAVMVLQALGLWERGLRLVFPAATYTIGNQLRPWVGLTAGTGDLACVLAIGIPFLFYAGRRWRYLLPAAGLALVATQALSGIVAGVVGALVTCWSSLRPRTEGDPRILGGAVAAFGGAVLIERGEIGAAITDARWSTWVDAAHRWFSETPWFGHGLGSWAIAQGQAAAAARAEWSAAQASGVLVYRDSFDAWPQLHFDLLQFGYEAGALGVALVVAVFVWAWRRASAAGNRAALGGLAALAVCQFGHFPLHLASAGVVAMLVLGEAVREKAAMGY